MPLRSKVVITCAVTESIHTPTMSPYLPLTPDEIARNLASKAHAVLGLDQAGWHTTGKLRLPDNLSWLPLPPKSPELNPIENAWQFLPHNKLSNRIFDNYHTIVTAAGQAWNSLLANPARITSSGTRPCAVSDNNQGRENDRGTGPQYPGSCPSPATSGAMGRKATVIFGHPAGRPRNRPWREEETDRGHRCRPHAEAGSKGRCF